MFFFFARKGRYSLITQITRQYIIKLGVLETKPLNLKKMQFVFRKDVSMQQAQEDRITAIIMLKHSMSDKYPKHNYLIVEI